MRVSTSFLTYVALPCLFLIATCNAHGHLTTPYTRDQQAQYQIYQMDAPVDASTSEFVCRNLPALSTPSVTIAAGANLPVRWDLAAPHPGDCFFYLSYDSQNWFKIAQIRDCNLYTGTTQSIAIPSWVPAGNAVLRWEWYALHLYVTVEFYAQCTDIRITNSGTGVQGTPTVRIPGHMPLDRNSYRNVYDPGMPFFFTGPALATAGGAASAPVITPAPTNAPVITRAPTNAAVVTPAPTNAAVVTPAPTNATPRPTTSPTCPPVGSGSAPAPAPAITPNPTNSPTNAPTAASSCPAGVAAPWGKCAGSGYTGPTCCPSGWNCQFSSIWYSQCIPASFAARDVLPNKEPKRHIINEETALLFLTGALPGIVIGALLMVATSKFVPYVRSTSLTSSNFRAMN